ncbi:hypothetical protein [Stenotrophomonas sp.]|uniref:hypothetical protein n=1 Tax=Stenotrophomonas sp. TaxID=69392 RepID=UPI00374CCDA3
MIIVYGTRSSASETRLATPCGNCRQPALTQSDWNQYFHVMFIPTFPVGKQRTIHCQACDNRYETKGSAPVWTFLGSLIFVACLFAGAGRQALRHFGAGASSASIASAAIAPSTTASAASAVASASAAPRAAAPRPAAASSHGRAPSVAPAASASSASAARPRKK